MNNTNIFDYLQTSQVKIECTLCVVIIHNSRMSPTFPLPHKKKKFSTATDVPNSESIIYGEWCSIPYPNTES